GSHLRTGQHQQRSDGKQEWSANFHRKQGDGEGLLSRGQARGGEFFQDVAGGALLAGSAYPTGITEVLGMRVGALAVEITRSLHAFILPASQQDASSPCRSHPCRRGNLTGRWFSIPKSSRFV